jgi:hypothetical protein
MKLHCLTRRASVAALALICAGFSLSTAAAAATANFDFAAAQSARTQAQANLSAGRAAAGGTQPAEAFANVVRAYPPSCLEAPLALGLYGRSPGNALQTQVTLYGDPLGGSAAEKAFSEIDTVTVFRVVCSGGRSAALIEIDRPAGFDATLYPIFPQVNISQNTAQGNVQNFAVRLINDPNTFLATTFAFSPFFNSDVYVLENFYSSSTPLFDYDAAFSLTVDNLNTADPNRITTFNLPAYNPAQYADASLPLPISGYMSTNWTSSTQGGEGIVMQVYDDHDSATRTLAFAWFTYDDNGLPFWLFGEADAFAIGTRSVTATTAYFTGGTFAGNLPAGVPHTIWGTVTFSFPDCGHMHVSYNGDAAAVHGPTGSGSATFQRVADVNGLVCQ